MPVCYWVLRELSHVAYEQKRAPTEGLMEEWRVTFEVTVLKVSGQCDSARDFVFESTVG